MVERKKLSKGGGGKLVRSETVQTRLSPQLLWMSEIMARQERRTLSSFIEKLIEEAAESRKIPAVMTEKAQTDAFLFGEPKYKKISIKEIVSRMWSTEEADRFVFFALFLPDLLTPEEAEVWQLIVDCAYFWEHFEINIETPDGKIVDKGKWPRVDDKSLIPEHLREHWPLLKAILENQEPIETFQKLKLPVGRVAAKPDYYPYPIKKVLPRHD